MTTLHLISTHAVIIALISQGEHILGIHNIVEVLDGSSGKHKGFLGSLPKQSVVASIANSNLLDMRPWLFETKRYVVSLKPVMLFLST